MSFITERKDIILIKYCILFLTIYYSQLAFIPVYCSCKKFSFSFSNNIGFFFLFFAGKIVFLLKYNHHCEFFFLIVFIKFLGLKVVIYVKLARLIGEKESPIVKMKYKITKNK